MSRLFSRSLPLLTAALIGAACSNDTTAPDLNVALGPLTVAAIASGPFTGVLPAGQIVTTADARNRALIVFPGATITSVDLNDLERELTVAEVKLLPAGGGGEVKLHFALATGKLAEVEGEMPPFTYAFAPGGEFASLAQALAAATSSSGKAGTVTEWKLQLEESVRWQYRFEITTPARDWRVRVDARTGAVNRIQDR